MRDLFSSMRKAGIEILKELIPLAYGVPFLRKNARAKYLTAPRRILLLNGFHIGDIVIATSVIPILRAAFPDSEIGFATGTWSNMVVQNHPDIRYTHCVDHWKLNRGNGSVKEKKKRYRETRLTALREIRSLRYDVAISLFTNQPDFVDLAWAAGIPVRIGFSRSIFARLATDVVEEPTNPFTTQGARLVQTLQPLPIDPRLFALRRATLPPSTNSDREEVSNLLGSASLTHTRYRIVHVGTGAARRELPVSFWRELAEELSGKHTLVFTGRGKRESDTIKEVIRGLNGCIDACDRLSWGGFVAAVQHAEILYGVESMAGHVAAAVGTRCVVVYGGTAGVGRWRPESESSFVITNHVQCAPCLRAEGCASMTCMQGFTPHDLVQLHE